MYALCVSGTVNAHGFVWMVFFVLYINFHSFILSSFFWTASNKLMGKLLLNDFYSNYRSNKQGG